MAQAKQAHDLKPCPFCYGGASQPIKLEPALGKTMRAVWTIGCITAYCVTVRDTSCKAVVNLWNTRDGVRPDGSKTSARLGAESVA